MRDWAKTLRLASFRGLEFWVELDGFSGGKRLALHEVAGGKTTVIEELGLATSIYELTIYFVGDDADLTALSYQALMLADGPGLLTLPIDGSQMATAQDFRRNRQKDRHGYIGFDVTFIPALNEGGAILSIGDVSSAVSSGFAAAATQFGLLFS